MSLQAYLSPDAYRQLQIERMVRLSQAAAGGIDARYREFKERYRYDPVGFVRDCFRWQRGSITDYQAEAMADLIQYKRESIRGPHGIGKTAPSAWLVHWFALTRDGDPQRDWKIPTTASGWPQLTKFLWPEIHKWARLIRWDRVGRQPYDLHTELMMLNLRLSTGEAFAISNQDSALIEGAHAFYLLFIFDESKSVHASTFDSAEGALASSVETGAEAYAWAVSTPGAPMGRFYDIQSRKPGYEDWQVRHVTKEEAIAAGRISAEWAEQRKRQWGAASALYLNHVEGLFAAEDTDSVIPLSWVERANQNWYEWEAAGFPGIFTGLGADIGGGGEEADLSTLAHCYDYIKIREVELLENLSKDVATMQVAERIARILKSRGAGLAIVDAIGIGAGVLNRLNQLQLPANAFIASMHTDLRDKLGLYGFQNWRAAGWWLLREMLDPESGIRVCLPPDDTLTGELTAPKYKEIAGRYAVESKESIRKRLNGHSTDRADAVIHILIGPVLLDELMQGRTAGVEYMHRDIGPTY